MDIRMISNKKLPLGVKIDDAVVPRYADVRGATFDLNMLRDDVLPLLGYVAEYGHLPISEEAVRAYARDTIGSTPDLTTAIERALKIHGQEHGMGMPEGILARFLKRCLDAFVAGRNKIGDVYGSESIETMLYQTREVAHQCRAAFVDARQEEQEYVDSVEKVEEMDAEEEARVNAAWEALLARYDGDPARLEAALLRRFGIPPETEDGS